MKTTKAVNVLLALLIALCLVWAGNALALPLGTNITMYDGVSSADTGWYGKSEDQEVEPRCATGQIWDLEGFFLKGSTLTVVAGYDLINGKSDYLPGDIFIDVDGDAQYGSANTGSGSGNSTVQKTFGYDFVLDLDLANGKYDVYALDSSTSVQTTTVYFSQNDESNPWRYDSGGVAITEWQDHAFSYYGSLSDSDVGGLAGGNHNALAVDLGFLGRFVQPGTEFIAHTTMECGNDNLMGKATVPEPATILLFGAGLIGFAGLGRKRLFKR